MSNVKYFLYAILSIAFILGLYGGNEAGYIASIVSFIGLFAVVYIFEKDNKIESLPPIQSRIGKKVRVRNRKTGIVTRRRYHPDMVEFNDPIDMMGNIILWDVLFDTWDNDEEYYEWDSYEEPEPLNPIDLNNLFHTNEEVLVNDPDSTGNSFDDTEDGALDDDIDVDKSIHKSVDNTVYEPNTNHEPQEDTSKSYSSPVSEPSSDYSSDSSDSGFSSGD